MKTKSGFRRFGIMLDCSRNAVMTVESLKKWIDITAELGIRTRQVYASREKDALKNLIGDYRKLQKKLEEKQLDFHGNGEQFRQEHGAYNSWAETVTANVISW